MATISRFAALFRAPPKRLARGKRKHRDTRIAFVAIAIGIAGAIAAFGQRFAVPSQQIKTDLAPLETSATGSNVDFDPVFELPGVPSHVARPMETAR
jgi:hypothetical protein